MSLVGYGDVTIFKGGTSSSPQTWRILVAILFMILSLVVSVVGFQAGLDSSFYPFRRRLDVFGNRIYEILRDANVVKGAQDQHDDVILRMRWAKGLIIVEICLIFLILNCLGVVALQLAVHFQPEGGETFQISWIESLYWAVQTTMTIGYGDIQTPDSFRWFLFVYLNVSTYSVGSALGKLAMTSSKLESMQRLYLWQQQEATYTMLADFSGRPDHRDDSGKNNEEALGEMIEIDPEINQFEFTIAVSHLLGYRLCYSDVHSTVLDSIYFDNGQESGLTWEDHLG